MRRKGFTLIELLVTISILSLLMMIAIISYQNVQKNSRDNKRKADLATIQTALEQYHADQGYYPIAITGGSPLANPAGDKKYLLLVPKDTQFPYSYTSSGTSSSISVCDNSNTRCINYCLYAPVENNSNAAVAPICGGAVVNQYQVQAP